MKSEKIIVDAGDMPHMEKTEKQRYPKSLDVGRIVIEETPEEKEPLRKRDVLRRDEVKETCEEIETHHQNGRIATTELEKDIVKVGRLDVTDYEKTFTESERVDKRVTSGTERSKFQQMVS